MKAFLLYLLVGGTVLYALNLLALHLWFDPPSSAAAPVVVQQDPQTLTAQFPAHQAENPAAEGSALVKDASIAGLRPTSSASNEAREFESSDDMSPEKVVVVLGAYAHREPNVSSAIEQLYPIGTELELLSRSDGWAYVRNPISKQTGWVLEQHYLAPVRTSGPKQVVKLEAQTPRAGPSSVSTKQTRKAAAQTKRKVVPPSSERAFNDFPFRWDPMRPRWNDQWDNRWQARRNWRRQRAFLIGPP
jgi:hypothetical protein